MANLTNFLLPKMGESITEGTILNWLVREGESFNEGDILVEVATDKVDNEVPAQAAGIMIKHLASAGDVIAIGTIIAQLEIGGDAQSITRKENAVDLPNTQTHPKTSPGTIPTIAAPDIVVKKAAIKQMYNAPFTIPDTPLFVSPLVNKIARLNHISFEELARIPATGHEGRLRKSDVVNYLNNGRPYQFAQAASHQPDPTAYRIPQLKFDKGTGTIIEMDRMRAMIADHMVYSKHTSPHVTAFVEVDVTDLVRFRESEKEKFLRQYKQKLTFTPFFIQAVAQAIKVFPNINASVDGKNIILKKDINVGMATALPSGNLIVPVVKNADQKSLPEIAADVNRMANLARENKLGGDDIKGGTFTISNVGTFGSLMGTPIINQPEVAILAIGIIKKRAEVITRAGVDSIEIRSMMMLSLSFDHRVVDGFLGGSFLKQVADNLEKPQQL